MQTSYLALAIVIVGLVWSSKAIVSRVIDTLLCWIYRAPYQAGLGSLPSLPFQWPNGQGTEKFFQGQAAAQRWRESYGSIYRIWSGWNPEIVLTKPHQVEAYFRDSHKHVKARNNNSGWLFGEVLGECVGLLSLQEWKELRKHVEAPFSRPSAAQYTHSVIEQTRLFVDQLSIGQKRAIDPAVDLQFMPFLIVASKLFGPLSQEQRKQLIQLAPLREELFKEVIRGGVNRWAFAPYVPWSGVGKLNLFQAAWETFVQQAYDRATTEAPTAPVVHLWDSVTEGTITKRQMLQTLDESLYANLDVTTSAVSWNIILIAQHPDMQTQLRSEISGNRDCLESYINRHDSLLAMSILEAARLRPILAFSNPESATEDKIIDGYLIKSGSDVVVDAAAINIDNPFWENARAYMPSRFSGVKREQARYNMWRFGFGPRQCLGQHVADRMLRAVLIEMVGRFNLSTDKTFQGSQHESWVGLPTANVTCTPIID